MIQFSVDCQLKPLVKPPITRELLKLYSLASEDPNPIHLNEDVAKAAKLPGVIAHGMLTMAFFGEFLQQTLQAHGQGRVVEMSCRFKAMTFPDDVITISGKVLKVNGNLVECDVEARNQKNELTAIGSAELSI